MKKQLILACIGLGQVRKSVERFNTLFLQCYEKVKKKSVTVFTLMLLCFAAHFNVTAQTSTTPEFTTIGTDFVLSFGQNMYFQPGDASLTLMIRIAATEATTVTFTFNSDGSSFIRNVPAGGLITEDMTSYAAKIYSNRPMGKDYDKNAANVTYETNTKKSLRVTSSKPISLYALNAASSTVDATNVLPVDNLGTTYYHISYPAASHYQDGETSAANNTYYDYANFDGYTLVATRNGTQITETIGSTTRTISLDEGGVYSFYTKRRGSLSGTRVTSNYPIAYFTTNTGTRVPNNVSVANDGLDTYGTTECLYQQLAPVSAWGTKYIVPVSARGTERIRIMASQDGTTLKINGSTTLNGTTIKYPTDGADANARKTLSLSKGQYLDLDIKTGCYIEANFPVGVCSFLMGNKYLAETTNQGDPAMAWIPALEQTVTSTTIAGFSRQAYNNHKAVIIVSTPAAGATTVTAGNSTQQLSAASFTTVATSGYSYYSYDLDVNSVYTFANPMGLVVLGYGYGASESYYYLAGAASRIINPHFTVNGIHHQEAYGSRFCVGEMVEIKSSISSRLAGSGPGGYATGSLTWYVNGIKVDQDDVEEWYFKSPTIGTFEIKMVVRNANGNDDECITQILVVNCCPPSGIIYVKDYNNPATSGSVAGDGYYWATAHPSLADALKTANESPGCITEIWVAEGIHWPSYDANGYTADSSPRERTFRMVNNVKVYGGFPPDANDINNGFLGTLSYEQALKTREWDVYKTILSGDIDKNDLYTDGVITAANGSNSYHVVTTLGVMGSALLDGFYVTGGNADGTGSGYTVGAVTQNGGSVADVWMNSDRGGGIYNYQYAGMHYENIRVAGNRALTYGGGLYNDSHSDMYMLYSSIYRNKTTQANEDNKGCGGGMYSAGTSNYFLRNVDIYENEAARSGGGLFMESTSSPRIINSMLRNNTAHQNGGGLVALSSANSILVNVLISDNRSTGQSSAESNKNGKGGGVFLQSSSNIELYNVTIAGNQSIQEGGGIYSESSQPYVENTIIWSNVSSSTDTYSIGGNGINDAAYSQRFKYSLVEGKNAPSPANGNIDGISTNAPVFVEPANGNYRLEDNSRGIDVGSDILFEEGYLKALRIDRSTSSDLAAESIASALDLDSEPRFQKTIDMGAYEKFLLKNLWIGMKRGSVSSGVDDSDKHLWSVADNWLARRLPYEDEVIEYHPDAIDLHVDGSYKALGIDASGSSVHKGLRILKNSFLELTSTSTALNLDGGELYIESGGPSDMNGSFVTVPDQNIAATVQLYSRAENAKTPDDKYNAKEVIWQYFGIPVKNYRPSNDDALSPQGLLRNTIVRRHQESTNPYWVAIDKNTLLEPFYGYEMAWFNPGDKDGYFEFTGELINSDKGIIGLTRTNGVFYPGQHVLANPYTAGLKINGGMTFNNLEETVYLFHTGSMQSWEDWKSGEGNWGNAPGQYLAVPKLQAGLAGLPETISSMQGFVVKVPEQIEGSLLFNYSGGVRENTSVMRSMVQSPSYSIVALVGDSIVKDRVWLFNDNISTRGYDSGYDGYKMFGMADLAQLYAVEGNDFYQVNTTPTLDETLLAFKAEKGVTDYILRFEHSDNLDETYERIFLIDLIKEPQKLNDITENGSEYSFSANNFDQAVNRFRIATKLPTDIALDKEGSAFEILQVDDQVYVVNKSERMTISVYSISGSLIHTTEIGARETRLLAADFMKGMYIIQCKYANLIKNQKIVIK